MGAAVCELLQRGRLPGRLARPERGRPRRPAHRVRRVRRRRPRRRVHPGRRRARHPALRVRRCGSLGMVPFLDLDGDEWDRVMDVNLRSVYRTVWVSARGMVDAGVPGCIVVNGSAAGRVADTGFAHYSVAKAGLRQLVRVAARELGPHGVRVNGVAPGFTITGLTAGAVDIPGFLDTAVKRVPLGRGRAGRRHRRGGRRAVRPRLDHGRDDLRRRRTEPQRPEPAVGPGVARGRTSPRSTGAATGSREVLVGQRARRLRQPRVDDQVTQDLLGDDRQLDRAPPRNRRSAGW